jgi:hypothetical protein
MNDDVKKLTPLLRDLLSKILVPVEQRLTLD